MALVHRCFRIGFAARDSAHKISHQSRQPTPPRSRATSDADVRRPPRNSRLTKSKQRGFFEAERDRIEKQGGSRWEGTSTCRTRYTFRPLLIFTFNPPPCLPTYLGPRIWTRECVSPPLALLFLVRLCRLLLREARFKIILIFVLDPFPTAPKKFVFSFESSSTIRRRRCRCSKLWKVWETVHPKSVLLHLDQTTQVWLNEVRWFSTYLIASKNWFSGVQQYGLQLRTYHIDSGSTLHGS